jgi:hypothetical protein
VTVANSQYRQWQVASVNFQVGQHQQIIIAIIR